MFVKGRKEELEVQDAQAEELPGAKASARDPAVQLCRLVSHPPVDRAAWGMTSTWCAREERDFVRGRAQD